MKFIHLSDLHLQRFYKENFDRKLSIKINEDIWKNFSNIVNYANENNIKIILIAGDIYEREYFTYTDMNRLIDIFKNYSGKIFISLGNHDYLKNSLWEKFTLPQNVHLFKDELSYVDVDEFSLRIFGISYNIDYFDVELENPDLSKVNKNILLIHGDVRDSKFLKLDREYLKQFNYIAMGHIHKREKVLPNAYYPGSIEPLSFKEEGEHGFLIVDTEDFKVVFKKSQIKSFKTIYININEQNTLNEVLNLINNNIDSKEDLYRFILKGRYKDIDYLINYIKNNIEGVYFEIVNSLEYFKTIDEIYAENPDSVISAYIDKMESVDELSQRALELGLKYLLEAKDGN